MFLFSALRLKLYNRYQTLFTSSYSECLLFWLQSSWVWSFYLFIFLIIINVKWSYHMKVIIWMRILIWVFILLSIIFTCLFYYSFRFNQILNTQTNIIKALIKFSNCSWACMLNFLNLLNRWIRSYFFSIKNTL